MTFFIHNTMPRSGSLQDRDISLSNLVSRYEYADLWMQKLKYTATKQNMNNLLRLLLAFYTTIEDTGRIISKQYSLQRHEADSILRAFCFGLNFQIEKYKKIIHLLNFQIIPFTNIIYAHMNKFYINCRFLCMGQTFIFSLTTLTPYAMPDNIKV